MAFFWLNSDCWILCTTVIWSCSQQVMPEKAFLTSWRLTGSLLWDRRHYVSIMAANIKQEIEGTHLVKVNGKMSSFLKKAFSVINLALKVSNHRDITKIKKRKNCIFNKASKNPCSLVRLEREAARIRFPFGTLVVEHDQFFFRINIKYHWPWPATANPCGLSLDARNINFP